LKIINQVGQLTLRLGDKMNKQTLKQKQKIVDDWTSKHGAAIFDLKNKNIFLPDGGLFGIEKIKYWSKKIRGYKKLPNGGKEVLFSKNKIVARETYRAVIWFGELGETIDYLKNMEKMLNKIGYKTRINKK
jgi:hypothetical protein